jgi:formylglycine-generating enzyme required for sulfatase activity
MRIFGLLILVSVITIGCGDDDPGPEPTQVGTITINAEPDSINASWQLTGPNAFTKSAAGDALLADMTAGSYTLTWGAVVGWTTPSPEAVTQSLEADGTLTFTGVYIEDVPVGFVSIPAGTFTMGSPEDEPGRDPFGNGDETQHQVTLTHGIYVQTTEVTNQQYMELAQWAYDHGYATATSVSLCDNLDGSTQELLDLDGYCEISFAGGTFTVDAGKAGHPVLDVTWYGSVAYCDWLSLQQGLPRAYNHATWQCNGGNPYTAAGYRLPTEAEWEYACRAGSTTAFANGPITQPGYDCIPIDPSLDLMGWYCGNSGWPDGWTHPLAQKLPNVWGLYDMHGNLWEWCNDWLGGYGGAVTDPVGPGAGSSRVIRGGGWDIFAQYCRSAYRYYNYPDYAYYNIGFRSVRSSELMARSAMPAFGAWTLGHWLGARPGSGPAVVAAQPVERSGRF